MKSLAGKSITQLKADLGWAITFISKTVVKPINQNQDKTTAWSQYLSI
jgi:hypothetical protein